MIRKIFFSLLVLYSVGSFAQNIKHIRFGTTDSPLSGLTITWRSAGSTDQIQWGYTKVYEQGQFNGSIRSNYTDNQFDYAFPAPISPNAIIYYKIYDSFAALWTSQKSFKTSSNPVANKFSFTALGDSRTYYSDWQTIGNCATAVASDFVLFGGDLTDDGNVSSNYDTWFNFGANFLSQSLIYYTAGNHENLGSTNGMANFKSLFTLPGNELYYSFIHGNAIFLVLNSENPGDATQLAWLRSTLAANSDKTWKFAVFHKPFYTAPAHSGEMDGYFSTLWKAFDDYGVDIIFNGHTHNYQRSKPINRNVSTTAAVAEYGSNVGQGRCEVVTGAAGAPLAGFSPASWWLETTKNELNYCNIAIDGTTLTFRAFSSSQNVLDQFQLVKGSSVQVKGIGLFPVALSLPGGNTSQLTPVFTPSNASNKLINWSSSAPSIATVNSLGIVTGVSTGNATITATTVEGGFTATCEVTSTGSGVMVGTGNGWRYLDNGSDQGTAWKAPSFNDAGWNSGASPLGYGAIGSVILGTSTLQDSMITYYFRKNFNYTLTGNETSYQMRVMVDDGCIVYFNGTEVYRNRLTGSVNYLTLAGNEAAEGTYYTVTLPLSAIINGSNTIAVEVHNTSTISSDIGFDLTLTPVMSSAVNYKALVSVFLEGIYNIDTGLMNLALNTKSQIPLFQPYNSSPWLYSGAEYVDSIPADVVDWVLLELRHAATPSAALPATALSGWPKAYFLNSNGVVVDLDGTSLPSLGNPEVIDNLYVVIRHRNHISIMSTAGMCPTGSNFNYDFTDHISKAYGGSAGYRQIVPGVFGMVSGDADADGSISVLDFSQWATDFGKSNSYLSADIDVDGEVSVLDFSRWATNFGVENIAPVKRLNVERGQIQTPWRYQSLVPGK